MFGKNCIHCIYKTDTVAPALKSYWISHDELINEDMYINVEQQTTYS